MEKRDKEEMSRRKFLKIVGVSAAASAAALYGCASEGKPASSEASVLGEVPVDKMTYRVSPKGERVSLLGYGCMRWPLKPAPDSDGNVIDQDAVNELVDYAIAHGVNYFDTSPVYCQGFSERATGAALKRYPREKLLIATKMSNFQNYTRENSIKMYHQSMKELQTDYLDYYLLHSVGGGEGIKTFHDRYIDNGVLDFLLKEREEGRIRNLGWSFHGSVEVFDYLLSLDVKWDFVQIQMNYVDWRHASGRNVNAEYLYGELAKRGIPAVIMEPLLGGRLSKLNDHLVARLKQRRPENSVSRWSNSGMVVEIQPEDLLCGQWGMNNGQQATSSNDSRFSSSNSRLLQVMHFQEELERQCWLQGGMKQTAPAQRMADFTRKKLSYDLPESSYSPGLVSSPLHFWMPEFISKRLSQAFLQFGRMSHGFLTNEAVMIGVETRTSSPVRIVRDKEMPATFGPRNS